MLTLAFAFALRIMSKSHEISGDVGAVFIMTLLLDACIIGSILVIIASVVGCEP